MFSEKTEMFVHKESFTLHMYLREMLCEEQDAFHIQLILML